MIQSHTRYQQSMDAITSNSDHRRYKKWIYPLLLILIFTLCLFPFKAIAATLSATQLYRWNGSASENAYGFFVKRLSDNGGDLNNPRQDGIPDIVISDFCESYGCGAVYVYSGKDYSLIFQLTGTAESYVTDVGDLNSDGVSDLFVSEMVLNDTFYTSRARVYSGLDGSPIPWLDFYGDSPGDNFGVCLSSIGDITGDGIPDLLVGASDMDEGAQNGGYIVLFSGADGSRIGRIDNPQTGNLTAMFGHSVSEAGDVNGDGTPDFIVGAPGANPQGITEAGRAYVFSGRIDLNFPVIYKLNGENSYDRLGGCCGSTDSVGDLNNDGRTELAVPAQYADPGGRINAGSYYIFDGAAGTQYQRPDGQGPLRFDGENPGDMLGGMKYCECGWIAVVGDLNNDGYKDFMVGAPWADVNNDPDAGQVLIFSGYDASILLRIDNPDPNHNPHTFGVGGANIGDLNGDGNTEVIIGAPSYAYLNPEIGSAYLFSLEDGLIDNNPLQVNTNNTFGQVESLALFQGSLFAGTRPSTLWKSDNGINFTDISNPDLNIGNPRSLVEFNNELYLLGYVSSSNAAGVWKSSDGIIFTNEMNNGFEDSNNIDIPSYAIFNGKLYAGTRNEGTTGGEVWKTTDGALWTQSGGDGLGNPNNVRIGELVVFNGCL